MSQEWTHKITDAFEKPKLIPEKESPIKENSNHLNDVLETMILGSSTTNNLRSICKQNDFKRYGSLYLNRVDESEIETDPRNQFAWNRRRSC